MRKVLVVAAIAILAAPLGGVALAASTAEAVLLGANPGKADAYSCYTRSYDDDHLTSHPKQKVQKIAVFVDTYVGDSGDRTFSMTLGVNFRKFKTQYEASGGCSTYDGQQSLTCGIDCDGGNFVVTTLDPKSITLAIPSPVALWDPNAPDDEPGKDLPKGASFGDDDKEFKLDKAELKECKSLMNDDQQTAILANK